MNNYLLASLIFMLAVLTVENGNSLFVILQIICVIIGIITSIKENE